MQYEEKIVVTAIENTIVAETNAIVANGKSIKPANQCWALVEHFLRTVGAKTWRDLTPRGTTFETQNSGDPVNVVQAGYVVR